MRVVGKGAPFPFPLWEALTENTYWKYMHTTQSSASFLKHTLLYGM